MSGEKKSSGFSARGLYEWIFRASLLLLGSLIGLNLAIALLIPVLPWLIGGLAMAAMTWIVIAVVRWRRSKW